MSVAITAIDQQTLVDLPRLTPGELMERARSGASLAGHVVEAQLLDNRDFSNLDLSGVVFFRNRLRGAKFVNVTGDDIQFLHNDLTDSLHSGARYSRGLIRGGALENADFSGLTGEDLVVEHVENAVGSKWDGAVLPSVVFHDVNAARGTFIKLQALEASHFCEGSNWDDSDWSEARTSGGCYRNSSLVRAVIEGMVSRGTDLSEAVAPDVRAAGADLESSFFLDTDMPNWRVSATTNLANTKLGGANIDGLDRVTANLRGATVFRQPLEIPRQRQASFKNRELVAQSRSKGVVGLH